MAAKQYLIAKAILVELKGERPQDARIHHLLGKTHFELNEIEPAIASFQEAVALNPQDAESINWIGALRQTTVTTRPLNPPMPKRRGFNRSSGALPQSSRRNSVCWPCTHRSAAIRRPNIFSRMRFSTPIRWRCSLRREYDTAVLGQNIQLVINLVSDADQTEALLPLAAELADRFGLPTVNHPRRVQQTTRDAIAQLLQGIPGCRTPQAVRLKAGVDRSEAALKAVLPFYFDGSGPAGWHPWRR